MRRNWKRLFFGPDSTTEYSSVKRRIGPPVGRFLLSDKLEDYQTTVCFHRPHLNRARAASPLRAVLRDIAHHAPTVP